MTGTSPLEVFAQREFEVDGIESALKLLIGKPQSDGQAWYCEYLFIGVSGEKIHKAYGVDSMQALLHALSTAKSLLKLFASDQYEITWLEAPDLGFSIIKTAQD